MVKKILALLLLFTTTLSFSQSLSEKATISILNCGTGNESYSLYGHTGIRINDPLQGIDIVFNYGAFDFETPNFMLKFVKGDLQYFVTTNYFADFEYNYQYEQRDIFEQELNLTPIQKEKLYSQLVQSLNSDEKFYTYKFIDRNCTTMVIDKVNSILGNNYITTQKPVTISYREILYPYLENHFFEKLGINIIFGTKVDQPAERLFLPLELIESLKNTEIKGNSLAKPVKTIYKAPENNFKPNPLNSIFTLIIALALIVLFRKKWLTQIYFAITGVLGVFFCLVGLYSQHEEVLWNYNVFLFNPIYLLLMYFYWKKNRKGIIKTGQILIFCLLGYVVYMLNKIHLLVVLPIIIANFILVSSLVLKHKKQVIISHQ